MLIIKVLLINILAFFKKILKIFFGWTVILLAFVILPEEGKKLVHMEIYSITIFFKKLSTIIFRDSFELNLNSEIVPSFKSNCKT